MKTGRKCLQNQKLLLEICERRVVLSHKIWTSYDGGKWCPKPRIHHLPRLLFGMPINFPFLFSLVFADPNVLQPRRWGICTLILQDASRIKKPHMWDEISTKERVPWPRTITCTSECIVSVARLYVWLPNRLLRSDWKQKGLWVRKCKNLRFGVCIIFKEYDVCSLKIT